MALNTLPGALQREHVMCWWLAASQYFTDEPYIVFVKHKPFVLLTRRAFGLNDQPVTYIRGHVFIGVEVGQTKYRLPYLIANECVIK